MGVRVETIVADSEANIPWRGDATAVWSGHCDATAELHRLTSPGNR